MTLCILPADSEDFQRNIINKPAYVEEKMDRFSSAFNGNLFVGQAAIKRIIQILQDL